MSSAFVLAAGLGTRLRPLSDHLPKPLVPIGDRPALSHVVDRVRGVGQVVVNAFHKADALAEYGVRERVTIVREGSLLGTAGGLRNAAPHLARGPVMVWNADILADLDALALVSAHESCESLATLAIAPRRVGEGTVGLDARGHVVRLRGERFGDEVRGGDFLGIHVVGPELREVLPEVGCLVGDLYLPALRRGALLASFEHRAPFIDVGTLTSYLEANLAWLAATGEPHWISEGATCTAAVVGSIVGRGARVDASLECCVVWPETVVTTPQRRAIVTPFGAFDVDSSLRP